MKWPSPSLKQILDAKLQQRVLVLLTKSGVDARSSARYSATPMDYPTQLLQDCWITAEVSMVLGLMVDMVLPRRAARAFL